VIEKYKQAVEALVYLCKSNNLVSEPQEVYNLKGDAARIEFIKNFKEVQRLKTQLDQYTDLTKNKKQKLKPFCQRKLCKSSEVPT
jgi:type I restriction enzyme R subunit